MTDGPSTTVGGVSALGKPSGGGFEALIEGVPLARATRGGLWAAALALLSAGAISVGTLLRFTADADWVARTHRVIQQTHLVLTQMIDVQNGLRGYIITGDPAFLEPYEGARLAVLHDVRELRRLSWDDPAQQPRVDAIGALISDRLAVAEDQIRSRRTNGFEGARASVAAGHGKDLMTQIRARVSEVTAHENGLLVERGQRLRTSARMALGGVASLGGVAFAILGLTAARIRREIQGRTKAQAQIAGNVKALVDFKAALDKHAIVAITDARGKISYVNDKFCAISKYSREELIGQDHRIINSGHHPKAFIRELWQTITSGYVWKGELKNRAKDGSFYWVDTTIVPFLDEHGKSAQYIAIRADITARKHAEETIVQLDAALRGHAAELETANNELKGFAYTVSHDLKAPLRGISGYAQELDRRHQQGLSDRAQFCIAQIITAARNLDNLIDDLLRYARLDAEPPRLSSVNLPDLMTSVLLDHKPTLARMGTELSVAVPPCTLRVWERGLRQVLTNLIDNAIKYSRDSKPPKLGIRSEPSSEGLKISVSDNGIGFDMKYHDRIFGLFNRLVRSNEFEGTGAGLAIVKKVVEKLGGTVRAQSAAGQGATFIVELPNAGNEAD